jgi:prolyl-tRNA editing enzyme YbaK/EbsC (Cys-tRNA(Pro) deacylase)
VAEPGSSTARVEAALSALGLDFEVRSFAQSTRTSAEAAAAIGCTVAQIAKSIIFKAKPSGRPVLVVASGPNRVDEKKIAAHLGEALGKADAEFVRARTGFAIGGVPPLGHSERVITYIDRDLVALDEIWAAAGTPQSVFCLTGADLARLTQGHVLDVRAED